MIANRWNFPPGRFCGNLGGRLVAEQALGQGIRELKQAAEASKTQFSSSIIGVSKAGRQLVGLTIGSGPCNISITAGAHADEPTGPMAAIALAEWLLSGNSEAVRLAQSCTWHICPHINPDGAEANRSWFSDPVDPLRYWNAVVREQPGDDIEFGYEGQGKPALRLENAAVAGFLRQAGPYVFHASLHAMALAEGAWFLIGESWRERTAPLRKTLAAMATEAGLGLHDMDRRGDKGFSRISRGFCTTPTSAGMKKHFLERNDPTTAELFHLNSMEFVQSLGGDPLVMVSEMPLFLIGKSASGDIDERVDTLPPEPGSTAYEQFRAALQALKTQGNYGETTLTELAARFSLRPVWLADHVQLQGLMVLEAIAFLEDDSWIQ